MSKYDRKHRWALTLLFTGVIFVILLLSQAVSVLAAYIMVQKGILFVMEEHLPEGKSIILFTGLTSLLLGSIIAFFAVRFPLRPFNRMISQMNRLASGDFKARLSFSYPLSEIPAFIEMSESFNKMAEELQNTEMLRSDFINNFSHEFKTPIVSIAGFAKLLCKGNLGEEERRQYLAAIEEESVRLAYMSTSVLNLTKVENQTILADVTTFNLSEQIRSAVLLLEPKWSKKEIDLQPDFNEHTIEANEELLKQVWINLIDNAVKFSPQGGTVSVAVQELETRLIVSVGNTGSEIAPEEQKRIFQKFYQTDNSHATEGSGIGLSIVKRIVELHRGEVLVESGTGKTTFRVLLPKTQ